MGIFDSIGPDAAQKLLSTYFEKNKIAVLVIYKDANQNIIFKSFEVSEKEKFEKFNLELNIFTKS